MYIILFGYEKNYLGDIPKIKLFGVFSSYIDCLDRISKIPETKDIETKISNMSHNVIHTNLHIFWWKVADNLSELYMNVNNS